MKPDILKMATRTCQRFVVVLIVAPALRWIFTGVWLVPMATIVCVMTAVVMYDLGRFVLDMKQYKRANSGKARPISVLFAITSVLAFGHLALQAYPLAKARIEIAEGVEYEATKRPFEHWSAFADRIIKDADAIEAKHERKR